MSHKPRIAVIGAGYWGQNLVRVFAELGHLCAVCDSNPAVLERMRRLYPDVAVVDDVDPLLSDPEVDAVAIALPANDHGRFAIRALNAGKHVFVEKPITLDQADARELVRLADERKLRLMVGHLLLYHEAVLRLKELIDFGLIGELYYLYSQRLNLGRIRTHENVLWSLAPHDISVIMFLLGETPVEVSCRGGSYIQKSAYVEDVVFCDLTFGDGRIAHLHCSWLDPCKIRRLTVVGSRKMVVFDDMEPTEKLKMYDKGIDPQRKGPDYETYGDALTLRSGDIFIPRLQLKEPLKVELSHFIESIREGSTPRSDGRNGLAVLQVLMAAESSLKQNGAPVRLESSA